MMMVVVVVDGGLVVGVSREGEQGKKAGLARLEIRDGGRRAYAHAHAGFQRPMTSQTKKKVRKVVEQSFPHMSV